ncbi:SBBP repeat-containing protein [Rufibacter psychrotolerans]|uniref:SBBP repeat-containing protein n=1 Tax=Rufibacter psychrotolerans TaxID=2812556 RepID=UPI001966FFD8|nr:SBBP repeat-containing protein [Rufibacter sp. SYSU D00308]
MRPFLLLFLLLFYLSLTVQAQSPQLDWVRSADGGGTSTARSVAVDKEGNVYVAGEFIEELTLGPFKLVGRPRLSTGLPLDRNMFVAKYDPAGNIVWAHGNQRSDPSSPYGSSMQSFGIALDQQGNCYVAGYTYNEVLFAGYPMGLPSNSDLFVMKLAPNGEVQWITEKIESLNYGKDVNLQVDAAGNSYIVGVPLWMVGTYLMKLDPAGKLQWKKGYANAVAARVSLDEKQGNLYVAGKLVAATLIDGISLTSAGASDVFVGKLDLNGNAQWVKRLGGTAPDSATGIAADGLGGVYVSGVFQGSMVNSGVALQSKGSSDGVVLKLKQDGQVEWAKALGGSTADRASHLTLSNTGRLFVTGMFTGQTTFQNKTYTAPAPTGTVYVAELGKTGAEKSFFTLAGSGVQQSNSLSAGHRNEVAFAGSLLGPVLFGGQAVETSKEQLFVARLSIPETPETPEVPEEPELPPAPLTVKVPNIITPNGDQKNDAFEVQVAGAPGSSIGLTVYNRHGKQVYSHANYQNNWAGEGLSESTYFYLVQVKAGDQVNSYKGWVEIVR